MEFPSAVTLPFQQAEVVSSQRWLWYRQQQIPSDVRVQLLLASLARPYEVPRAVSTRRIDGVTVLYSRDELGLTRLESEIKLLGWLQSSGLRPNATLNFGKLPSEVQDFFRSEADRKNPQVSRLAQGRGKELKLQFSLVPKVVMSDGTVQATFVPNTDDVDVYRRTVEALNEPASESELRSLSNNNLREPSVGPMDTVYMSFGDAVQSPSDRDETLQKFLELVITERKELAEQKADALSNLVTQLSKSDLLDKRFKDLAGQTLEDQFLAGGRAEHFFQENKNRFQDKASADRFLRTARVTSVNYTIDLSALFQLSPHDGSGFLVGGVGLRIGY
jgi:hypothetical protein